MLENLKATVEAIIPAFQHGEGASAPVATAARELQQPVLRALEVLERGLLGVWIVAAGAHPVMEIGGVLDGDSGKRVEPELHAKGTRQLF